MRWELVERAFRRHLTGSGTSTGATPITVLTIPIPNDSVVHLRSYTAAMMTLLSNFSGANKADNQGFDAGIGDWVQGTGGVLASAAGGQTANGGQYTVGAAPSTTLMSLVAGLDNLIVGRKYRLTFYLKYETNWDGGDVTITIDGQTKAITPTTSYVLQQFDFEASAIIPTIAFTCAAAPTLADILWIDTFELTELAGASYDRISSYKNTDGTVSIIGSITSPHVEEDRTAWQLTQTISGTNVLIRATGEASATIKWLAHAYRTIVLL